MPSLGSRVLKKMRKEKVVSSALTVAGGNSAQTHGWDYGRLSLECKRNQTVTTTPSPQIGSNSFQSQVKKPKCESNLRNSSHEPNAQMQDVLAGRKCSRKQRPTGVKRHSQEHSSSGAELGPKPGFLASCRPFSTPLCSFSQR